MIVPIPPTPMVETILGYGLVATLLVALVQFVKKQSGANGMLVLAGISILGGIVYALLVGFNVWDMVAAKTMIVMAAANTIWNVFDQVNKAINPDDSNV